MSQYAISSPRRRATSVVTVLVLTVTLVSAANAVQVPEWLQQFGGPGYDQAAAIVADATGAYVVGSVGSGSTTSISASAFLRRYASGGAIEWTQAIGTTGWDAFDVALHEQSVYVVGRPAFVQRRSLSGELIWESRLFGIDVWAKEVAVDSTGVYVTGRVGSGALPGQVSAGSIDAYTQKLDHQGNLLWTRQFGSTGQDETNGIVVRDGALYVGGFVGTALPGQVSAGGADVFLQKRDLDGNVIWTRQFGTAANDFRGVVAADNTGVYVGGDVEAALPDQTYAGSTDGFLRKYDPNGNEVWTRQFGGSSGESVLAIALDGNGIYLGGATSGTLTSPVLASGFAAFEVKFDRDGARLWTHQFARSSFTYGMSSDGSALYVVGGVDNAFPGQTFGGQRDGFVARLAEIPNSPPHADAGPDQMAPAGSFVVLTACGSRDPEGEDLFYRWTVIEADGPAISLLRGIPRDTTNGTTGGTGGGGEDCTTTGGSTGGTTGTTTGGTSSTGGTTGGTTSAGTTSSSGTAGTGSSTTTTTTTTAGSATTGSASATALTETTELTTGSTAGSTTGTTGSTTGSTTGTTGTTTGPTTGSTGGSTSGGGSAVGVTMDWPIASFIAPDRGTYVIRLTVYDIHGQTGFDDVTIRVNSPPVATITEPASGAVYSVGVPVTFHGTFTDLDGLDEHTAAWTLTSPDAVERPIATITEVNGSGTVTATHTFSRPGIYQVMLEVTDRAGVTSTTSTVDGLEAFVVIFDAGHVAGGGWIDSPAGAYRPDPDLSGRATFGFVAQYAKGAQVPSGRTQFQFQAGSLRFESASYDWLVVAGSRAKLKGTGTIAGNGDYAFMLSAIDAEERTGEVDRFRIRIWDKSTEEEIYDNEGGSDTADPSTAIGGGSIVIRR